jgi:chromosome segregation ATPase
MELTQLSQMVQWLDEERRKDKALIAALQEQVKLQAQQLAQQQELIAALQRTVAGMETLMAQVTGFAPALEGLKADVGRMLELREEQWRKELRESERARQLEIGALKDEIARVAEGLRQISRLEEGLAALQAETRRLTEDQQRLEVLTTDLKQHADDRAAAVIYLEEQRRADNKRITALEAEATELRRRIETTDARLPLLEEAVQKQKRYLEEGLKPIKEFEKVVEELRVADFRRNQEVKKWAGQAEEVRQEIERLREERQRLMEQYQRAQRSLDALSALQTRLETRQNETAEMQRLAEERLKRQWEEWQSAQEKERRNWEVTLEERRRQQERFNATVNKRLDQLTATARLCYSQIAALWETRRADAIRTFTHTREAYEARIAEIDQQLAALKEHPLEE